MQLRNLRSYDRFRASLRTCNRRSWQTFCFMTTPRNSSFRRHPRRAPRQDCNQKERQGISHRVPVATAGGVYSRFQIQVLRRSMGTSTKLLSFSPMTLHSPPGCTARARTTRATMSEESRSHISRCKTAVYRIYCASTSTKPHPSSWSASTCVMDE